MLILFPVLYSLCESMTFTGAVEAGALAILKLFKSYAHLLDHLDANMLQAGRRRESLVHWVTLHELSIRFAEPFIERSHCIFAEKIRRFQFVRRPSQVNNDTFI